MLGSGLFCVQLFDLILFCIQNQQLHWTKESGFGEEFYRWCCLVADGNEKCHPHIDKEFLRHMRTRADEGDYKHGNVDLRGILKQVIRLHEFSCS